MKMIALAAALLVGTAAVAQTMPVAPATPPADMTAPMPSAPPSNDAMTSPAPSTTAAPMPNSAVAAQPVAQASYPRCSATVTDQCHQSAARESDRKGGPPKHRRQRG